ncbi:hypothetical protein N8071_00575 [bacterium]|nr:hypothetical protein [bacterium]
MAGTAHAVAPPRIAVYTHDTFGMGHVRRCLNIIDQLAARRPDAAIMLVTGSPALDAFGARPANVDIVKLPTIAPTGDAPDRPPHLPIGAKDLIRIRRKTIRELLSAFAPDVFLVDNFALGARKELAPTLEMLAARPTRSMLGLRDIVDAPETIRMRWPRDGIIDALQRLYDDILVFGHQGVFDVAEAYDLAPVIAAKIRYCGYVARAAAPATDAALSALGIAAPYQLVTVGGGGDGLPLLRAFLEGRGAGRDMPALVVTGPLMGAGPRAEVEKLASAAQGVKLVEFLPDLPAFMARAEVVVAMGGYNTVAELMRSRRRAVLAPRNWRYGQHAKGAAAGLELEQAIRAEKLAEAGLAVVVPPEALTPEGLARAIDAALAAPRPEHSGLGFDGAEQAAEHIIAALEEMKGERHAKGA